MRWQQALEAHASEIVVGVGLFIVSLVASLAAVAIVLVRMPPHHFQASHPQPFWADRPAWQRTLGRIGKNLLGLALVVLGAILSLPGVPGQGLLTMFIGLVLLDFPGKRALERRIIAVPAVFHGANRLRARFGSPPFVLDDEKTKPD